MPDSRFFKKAGPFTLQQLAEITQTEIGPHSDAGAVYENVGSLQDGTDKDVSFLLSKNTLPIWKNQSGRVYRFRRIR